MPCDLVAQEGFHVERPLNSPLQNFQRDIVFPELLHFEGVELGFEHKPFAYEDSAASSIPTIFNLLKKDQKP